jgi:glycosyltransferase involved in cell wall biosynthesis
MGKEYPRITLIHAFDAHAGAQRVAAALAVILRDRGFGMRLWLGFGDAGFVSEARPDWRFLPTRKPAWRKLLYPLWLVAINLAMVGALLRGDRVWANSIAAVPAAGPFLLFAPRRLIIHLHENRLPPVARAVVAWAGRRGAMVLAVSRHHADQLDLDCRVLPNAVGQGTPPPAPAVRDRLVFVGTASAMKGFPLFLSIVQRLDIAGLRPIAFLAGGPDTPSGQVLADARALGIETRVGEPHAAVHHANGFLLLQLTDPLLADETFSLVSAEALWHLVPVGGGGSAVLPEVVGAALAFNMADRDPAAMAQAIRSLWADRQHYQALVDACRAERPRYSLTRFADDVAAIAGEPHG